MRKIHLTARSRITDWAPRFLHPDETIEAVMSGQTSSPLWGARGLWGTYRAVVATNHRIVVLECRSMKGWVTGLEGEFPRSTILGPTRGLWRKTKVLGRPIYITRWWFRDIATADAGANR